MRERGSRSTSMGERFLDVIDAQRAHRLFRAALDLSPRPAERVRLEHALGRVLAEDVVSRVDVPGFDRSNVDGYAVRAEDTFGADEGNPRELELQGEELSPGIVPQHEVVSGSATYVATGGMIPRGADAVVMIEHVDRLESSAGEAPRILIRRAAAPGSLISFAGSDIAHGEVVERAGTVLTARETGVLAAIGCSEVAVVKRLRVAVFSTGNEIVAPGSAMRPGLVYDSNLRILADTLRELGCEPVELGVVGDDPEFLRDRIARGLECDALIYSGGTSKGMGDLGVAVLEEYPSIRIVCHGVAVKPGKPICLAVSNGKPVVVLPGFPTSAVFTFHEFVAPVLRELAGAPPVTASRVTARVPFRIHGDRGRTEFVLVSLVERSRSAVGSGASVSGVEWVAYPIAKGSGSVTSFSKADGFLTIGRHQEFVDVDESVEVQLLGRELRPADLVVVGSHCVGLDLLLSRVRELGFTSKAIAVGSRGGFLAAERGECDVAGVHLCDDAGVYNTPFLTAGLELERGYERMQGILSRADSPEPDVKRDRMVNRNRGSGTRQLIDELLAGARPPGFSYEAKSHHAVAAAVAQGRADWGIAIESVAAAQGLRFRAYRAEAYDFVIPTARRSRPAVQAFLRVLRDPATLQALEGLGLKRAP